MHQAQTNSIAMSKNQLKKKEIEGRKHKILNDKKKKKKSLLLIHRRDLRFFCTCNMVIIYINSYWPNKKIIN